MNKVDGFIDDGEGTDFSFTYSEEEKQEHELNASNAKLVFSPEFIPFYPAIQKKYGLTNTETLIYGFIRFFTTNASSRFYFSNSQIGEVVSCNDQIVSRAINKLRTLELLCVNSKPKAGGGTIRFVSPTSIKDTRPVQNIPVRLVQNILPNKNKINENNIQKEINEEKAVKIETEMKFAGGVLQRVERALEGEKKISAQKEGKYPTFNSIATDFEALSEIALKYGCERAEVVSKLDDMKNWFQSKGKTGEWNSPYKNYKAALMKFVKDDIYKKRKEKQNAKPNLVWGSSGRS